MAVKPKEWTVIARKPPRQPFDLSKQRGASFGTRAEAVAVSKNVPGSYVVEHWVDAAGPTFDPLSARIVYRSPYVGP